MLFHEYKSRCAFLENIGTPRRLRLISSDIGKVNRELDKDLEFLTKGSEEASQIYNRAVQGGGLRRKKCWN